MADAILLSNIPTKTRISFEVYPADYFGTSFTDVIFEGFFSSTIAANMWDIHALHAAVYNTLPAGTPDDPTQYDYICITDGQGNRRLIGAPYINMNTLVQHSGKKVTLVFNALSNDDLERVMLALSANGITPDSRTFD